MSKKTVYINAFAMNSALGNNEPEIVKTLNENTHANMCINEALLIGGKSTVVGQINNKLPKIPDEFKKYNSRNNRIALSVLEQIEPEIKTAIKRYGSDKVAVIVGTSTSGISDAETALKKKMDTGSLPEEFYYEHQELGNLSEFIANYYDIEGPAYTISTACSSSGRVFLSAKRMLYAGVVDAVIVGGVDSLCKLTVNGFDSLGAISYKLCNPFSKNRDGINIGEGGGFILLSLEKNGSDIAFLGAGDSSDAHHISAPHPEGLGAIESMKKALFDANLEPSDIGYINAHGTSTKLNDSMESKAIYALFSNKTPVSSTKPLTGHCLGSAGIIEAIISVLILKYKLDLPIQINDNIYDDSIAPINIIKNKQKLSEGAILSNSFAFGGNNISLIFGYKND